VPDVIQRGLDEPGNPFAFHFAPAMRHPPQGAASRLDATAMDHSYASSELQAQKGSSLSIEYHASLVSIHLSAIASVRNTTWAIFRFYSILGAMITPKVRTFTNFQSQSGLHLPQSFHSLASSGCGSNFRMLWDAKTINHLQRIPFPFPT